MSGVAICAICYNLWATSTGRVFGKLLQTKQFIRFLPRGPESARNDKGETDECVTPVKFASVVIFTKRL